MGKKKKQYIEKQIFSIYPDYPVLIHEEELWDEEIKPLHFHYYLELGYCLEGSGVILSNDQETHVQKGDFIIGAPNILHTQRADTGVPTKWLTMYVDMEDLVKLFPYGETRVALQMSEESFSQFLCLKGEDYPAIIWIVKEIARLHVTKSKNYRMEIMGLLFTLMYKLYNVFAEEKREEYKKVENLPIMPAIQYIYKHYMEDVKVLDLAKECHFSESYFRKVFTEMKGITPVDYLNSIRIREACKMLMNTNKSVRVVGEKCGYNSMTTFERNFKKRIGMLPSQWREEKRSIGVKDRESYDIKSVFQENGK